MIEYIKDHPGICLYGFEVAAFRQSSDNGILNGLQLFAYIF